MPRTNIRSSKVHRKPNYTYSVIIVSVVLFLLGLFGLLWIHANGLARVFQEQVDFLIEIAPDSAPDQIDKLAGSLQRQDCIKERSLEHITKEAAYQELQTELGEDISQLGLENPLFDMLRFQLRADCLTVDSLQSLEAGLRSLPIVRDVIFQKDLVAGIDRLLQRMAYWSLGFGLLMLLIAIVLVHNTVRLAIYARRMLIKNMELVGASWHFITRPFLWQSIINGLVSTIIASLLLAVSWFSMQHYLPEINSLYRVDQIIGLFIGILLLGLLINFVSTYFVVHKYLKMQVDDLY